MVPRKLAVDLRALPAGPRLNERLGRKVYEEGIGVVLGIDPGTQVMGYGAVRVAGRRAELVETGTVRARRERSLAERLGFLQQGIEDLLDTLTPAVVVVERAFFGRNVHSALRLGEGRGLVLAAAARRELQIAEIAPAAVKRALVGNGQAEKGQVSHMVGRELGLDLADSPDDATDALALALCWLFGRRNVG
jgi:crossover junction endodeoxyribonuclease RuvC